MEFKDKVVLITGSGQGIGKVTALFIAKEGATVIINDINSKTAKSASEELKNHGYLSEFIVADISVKEEVKKMFSEIVQRFKRIDILINNAGVCKVKPIDKMDIEEWDYNLSVNGRGTFLCTKAAVEIMKKQESGCIISMTSIHGLMGAPERGPFSFCEAGIVNLTHTLAAELGRYNIRINAIAPSFTLTEGFEEAVAMGIVDKDVLIKLTPMRKLIEPEDIANAVVFLASDKARLITGITLPIDGGWLSDGVKGMKRPSE